MTSRGYIIDGKDVDILEEDWDFLIILDACRYDMFKSVYKEIFGERGVLKKAISPATWTMEWLNKIFDGKFYDNIIYISGNVFVNSKQKIYYESKKDKRYFDAKKHFFKVIDVWDFGWNNNLNTVHPIEINKAFHKYYLKYPNKRFILHYVQPHQPFITIKEKNSFDRKKRNETNTLFRRFVRKYLPEEIAWKIKKMLNFPVGSDVEKIYREKGWKGIKEVYKNEIRLVLEHVKMLTDSITGNFIITADHGERLGEYLFNDRHGGKRDKEVIEVPWFEVKKIT